MPRAASSRQARTTPYTRPAKASVSSISSEAAQHSSLQTEEREPASETAPVTEPSYLLNIEFMQVSNPAVFRLISVPKHFTFEQLYNIIHVSLSWTIQPNPELAKPHHFELEPAPWRRPVKSDGFGSRFLSDFDISFGPDDYSYMETWEALEEQGIEPSTLPSFGLSPEQCAAMGCNSDGFRPGVELRPQGYVENYEREGWREFCDAELVASEKQYKLQDLFEGDKWNSSNSKLTYQYGGETGVVWMFDITLMGMSDAALAQRLHLEQRVFVAGGSGLGPPQSLHLDEWEALKEALTAKQPTVGQLQLRRRFGRGSNGGQGMRIDTANFNRLAVNKALGERFI